jgi:hypothetical protein
MVLAIISISWIALSLLMGYIGLKRKVGFYDAFFSSLLLSPILGAVLIFNDN